MGVGKVHEPDLAAVESEREAVVHDDFGPRVRRQRRDDPTEHPLGASGALEHGAMGHHHGVAAERRVRERVMPVRVHQDVRRPGPDLRQRLPHHLLGLGIARVHHQRAVRTGRDDDQVEGALEQIEVVGQLGDGDRVGELRPELSRVREHEEQRRDDDERGSHGLGSCRRQRAASGSGPGRGIQGEELTADGFGAGRLRARIASGFGQPAGSGPSCSVAACWTGMRSTDGTRLRQSSGGGAFAPVTRSNRHDSPGNGTRSSASTRPFRSRWNVTQPAPAAARHARSLQGARKTS